MQVFNIYITDLFCRELNYSYVTRFNVKARTVRGAVSKVAKYTGLNFRLYNDHNYEPIYHSTSKLTGLVVEIEPYHIEKYDNAITI